MDSVMEKGYATDLITGHALDFIEEKREDSLAASLLDFLRQWEEEIDTRYDQKTR